MNETKERQFSTFTLGKDLFGVDILLVREINRNLDITPVDHAPEFVRGLLNLRGQVVTVCDLGTRLGLGARELQKGTNCIILKTQQEIDRNTQFRDLTDGTANDQIGLLVDAVGEVITVRKNQIAPPPSKNSGINREFIDGVIKLPEQLLVTLRISKILAL